MPINNSRKHLNADSLFSKVRDGFDNVPDHRQSGKTKISITDALMSGLAVFSLKSPSLLCFEREIRNTPREKNLQTLFGIGRVPDDTNMRSIIDEIDPKHLTAPFKQVFSSLQKGKVLERFQFLNKYYLIACDGTGYFSSKSVHCAQCCEKHHRDGTTSYHHQFLTAALVHPKIKQAIPINAEPIIKQEGSNKNDCERNAGIRLVENIRREHPHLKIMMIEDALSGNLPRVLLLRKNNMNFILGVKPGSQKDFFERIDEKELARELAQKSIETDGFRHEFSFVNGIILNAKEGKTRVNFLKYIETDASGKTKKFSWITDVEITEENVYELMRGGRSRWHIENQVFNSLKNAGYQFEHNFGHGKKNLSTNFAYLMLLAFLIDQTQELCCEQFRNAKTFLGPLYNLWEKLRNLFDTFVIEDWKSIWAYLSKERQLIPFPPDSS